MDALCGRALARYTLPAAARSSFIFTFLRASPAAPPVAPAARTSQRSGCVSAAASGRSPSCPDRRNRSAGAAGLAAGSCSGLLRTSCCCGLGTRCAAAVPPQMSREPCPGQRCAPRIPRIPQPRGGRARRAVFVLLALCAAALLLAGQPLVPTARSLSFHFATLQIGALLKGACYLAEEIFHLHSRHHGSFWRALSTCFPPGWHGPMLLICGSAYVALFGDGQPLGLHFILASLCQLLILALGLQKPSAVEMSEMSERSKQNVAHGLAWSYYVGYLKIVLPRLKKSMEEFSRGNPNLLACRKTWKLHILIPLSCDVYDDLEKADSNIQYMTDLTETTLARAGTKKRVYKHSLYAIRDEENQLWHCAVEYATPLQSLYAMSQDECAAFSREERLEQAKLFYRTLEEILKGSKECADTYRLIAYEEPEEAETHFLSREIVWHLRQEHQEEIAVLEGSDPHSPCTALDSAELNLQVSVSDLPQPLRTDGF
ncbi:stimulator of interferon genes protein isoform X2 [Oenanthe melanoleuca]|uniref:stimulator of interferon genes protein isoform X2 n=1 Tax=Oenanthe melanoleuca TaxID=2939378 RepID=UPI0024C132E2|nr:stimulator of interferon genes protein isoform X2 [Oenanthe melanoleuca]